MSVVRTSDAELVRLRDELSVREIAIVSQVAELRLMSGRQIARVHFADEAHGSAEAASRACRRSLERLAWNRLLIRLERRIGGVRAGSGSFVYALGPVGQRLIGLDGPRRRFREPSASFVDHTLAVSELVVELILADRAGRVELLEAQAEPACWRSYSDMSGRKLLRPDLFVALGIGEYELRHFIEMDRGTEHLPAVLRKCRAYDAYYRSGREQARHEVFPRVLWIAPNERRCHQIATAIGRDGRLNGSLFAATTTDGAVEYLAGGER